MLLVQVRNRHPFGLPIIMVSQTRKKHWKAVRPIADVHVRQIGRSCCSHIEAEAVRQAESGWHIDTKPWNDHRDPDAFHTVRIVPIQSMPNLFVASLSFSDTLRKTRYITKRSHRMYRDTGGVNGAMKGSDSASPSVGSRAQSTDFVRDCSTTSRAKPGSWQLLPQIY